MIDLIEFHRQHKLNYLLIETRLLLDITKIYMEVIFTGIVQNQRCLIVELYFFIQ